MEPVYRTVIAFALAVQRVMRWDVRTRGIEHLPASGPAVVAANHVGLLDFVFIGTAARERNRLVRFMALREAFGHWLGGPLLRAMKHIQVDRYGDANAAFVEAVGALRRGEVVGLHPESRISRSFVPSPGKTGAARMAIEAGTPLIPCVVWGSQRIWTPGHRHLSRRDVVISVDLEPPVPYAPSADPAEVTVRLMDAIGRGVERAAVEYPQRPRGPADRWWVPAHLGGGAPTREAAQERADRETARRRAARE